MRFCLDVVADVPTLAWKDVHGPIHSVLYRLLGSQNAELAEALHDAGWEGSGLRPMGACPPMFSTRGRVRGSYSASGPGFLWMGSPVPSIAGCLLSALVGQKTLQWGPVRLTVSGVRMAVMPDFFSGEAVFDAVSPIVVKQNSIFLVPDDSGFVEALVRNTKHKADVLGLPSEVEIEVLDSGPRRRFEVGKGVRAGATAKVRMAAAPALLEALYSWGLGLNTNQGFGWVR